MPVANASSKPAPVPPRPDSGPAALLRAIGLSAVQVGPEVVALRTSPVKRAA